MTKQSCPNKQRQSIYLKYIKPKSPPIKVALSALAMRTATVNFDLWPWPLNLT